MNLTCPECKNEVDLSSYGAVVKDQGIECDTCGISLVVTGIDGDEVNVDIMDEGK